jgi:hypothetical protein
VLGEVKPILTAYAITSAIGDQYCCEAISEHLQNLHIAYKIVHFGAQTRPDYFRIQSIFSRSAGLNCSMTLNCFAN